MNNTLKNKIDKEYEELYKVVPLDTPLSVHIEAANICNFQCSFCPTSDKELLKKHNRPSGMMTFEMFKKIINDLKYFNGKIKTILFHKDGESLLNPLIAKMIAYTKESNI